MSGGYGPGGYPGPGYGAPRYGDDPEPADEQWPGSGRRPRDGSVWENDQDQAGYGPPGDTGAGYPPRPGYGAQQPAPGGYGDWEQDPQDGSFLPGFDRRGQYDDGRRGQYDDSRRAEYDNGRAPAQDRYYEDDYGARGGQSSWPGDRAADDPYDQGRPDQSQPDWGRDDRDRGPARRKRATRWAPRVLILVIFLALVIGGTVGGLDIRHDYEARYHPADYASAGTGDVTVQVPSGATAFSLAPELLKLHVIASVRAFTNAAESAPATTSSGSAGLEAGYYQLQYHMKASLAYAALLNTRNLVQVTVTIPEGKRVTQVIAIVSARTKIPLPDFRQVLARPAELGLPSSAGGKAEGYLFPATYAISPHETARQILQAMVQRFGVEADAVSLTSAARSVGLSPAQLIVEASLAQAEGGSVADYPKIAEVIHNRLARGMKLQFDSTVLYGLGRYAVSATDKQIDTRGPYNTYLNTGLPPGPISNPGDAAIQGILHPDTGDWLYFLTKPGGKSQFSATPLKGQ